jgi:hypothetical protein
MLSAHRAPRVATKLSSPRRTGLSRRFFQNRQSFFPSQRSFSSPRPQIPFLSSSLTSSPRILARLIYTEKTGNFRRAIRDIGKWTAVVVIFTGLLSVIQLGFDHEILERTKPTPKEWSWITRLMLRRAHFFEEPGPSSTVDWGSAGEAYHSLLARLEDTDGDGVGLRPQLGDGEHIFVEGIGKTGYDISGKSERWRAGYHDALMGAARVAENLEYFVRDKTRNLVFPRHTMKGPSNPELKHVGPGKPSAPREEDCEAAFDPPHKYYMKIITTHGFSARQRLNAALAYAEYLRSKGLYDSAGNMYDWAFDIALAGLGSTTSAPVDRSTGVLDSDTSKITSNILLTATSLGVHYAQMGNLQAALPVFLSVLRVQQNLPPSPITHPAQSPLPTDRLGVMMTLFSRHPDPPAEPSGDEPATATPATACASSGTMLYIGEVLYASSGSNPDDAVEPSSVQRVGINWTRQALDLAESNIRKIGDAKKTMKQERLLPDLDLPSQAVANGGLLMDPLRVAEAKKRCSECLIAGLENWRIMIEPFVQAAMSGKEAGSKLDTVTDRHVVQSMEKGLSRHQFGDQHHKTADDSPRVSSGHETCGPGYSAILEGQEQVQRDSEIKRLLIEHGLDPV